MSQIRRELLRESVRSLGSLAPPKLGGGQSFSKVHNQAPKRTPFEDEDGPPDVASGLLAATTIRERSRDDKRTRTIGPPLTPKPHIN
jgi:hypothetical protein